MSKPNTPRKLITYADEIKHPGKNVQSSAHIIGEKLKKTMQDDPTFYFFSPDETTSNKLDAVYQVSERAWLDQPKDWDLPESPSGRIIELLSENTLVSCLIGHILSGKQGMMASYEAFFNIIISQIIQYVKFVNQADQVSWRSKTPALNLLSTSTCWRQDHNGYSHQSPALISALLSNPSKKANCFFPVDSLSAAAIFEYMLETQNVVNLTTFNKTDEPIWIDSHHAKFQLKYGASVFDFASSSSPKYIFTAAGDIVSREALYAIKILKTDLPEIPIRFVGVAALSYDAIGTIEKPMPQNIFDEYFGKDTKIIANFHGYPKDFGNILERYISSPKRLWLHGYSEYGSTTTPFEMLSLNLASRYHLCIDVAKAENRQDLVEKYENILAKNRDHAAAHGVDLPEITDFRF